VSYVSSFTAFQSYISFQDTHCDQTISESMGE
jgi:hypothetical protein